jgi:hypothetical protein
MDNRTTEEINGLDLHEQLLNINEKIESLRSEKQAGQSGEYWTAIAEKQRLLQLIKKQNRIETF